MKKLILIIEDDEIIRSIIFEFLELENFNVISAEDGCQGLTLAEELQPDLIICDINMPNANGYTVLQKIRENVATTKIPFIFLSSETTQYSRNRARLLGANDYLSKPVKINQLLEAITNQFQQLHTA
ncbi:MAG: response regulator [Potamolinea sp.]